MAKKPAKTTVSAEQLSDLIGESLEASRMSVLRTASSGITTHLISSGVAALDNLVGGGIRYGTWASIAGPEKSGKSLLVTTMAGSFLRNGMARVIYDDAEGSQEVEWMKKALRDPEGRSYFGVRNKKGLLTVKPRIDINNIEVIEDAFDYVTNFCGSLPDKIYIEHEDQWYLCLSATDKRVAHYRNALGTPDRSKSTRETYWYPVPHAAPQFCWIVDSWPLLNTAAEEEAGQVSRALGVNARAFSQQVGRIRGKIRKKAAIVLGINQLREKPNVTHGSPFYEPGGNALKFVTDLRLWAFERVVPSEYRTPDMTGSKFLPEPSVEGPGEDHYEYKEIQVKKSKLRSAVGDNKTWMRVWVKDYMGYGRGIDPVFDVFQFLLDRKFARRADLVKNRAFGRNAVEFLKSEHPLAGKILKWSTFKVLVLAEVSPSPRVTKAAEAEWKELGVKPFGLSQWCFDHMPTPVPVVDMGVLEDFEDDTEGDEETGDSGADATSGEDTSSGGDSDEAWGDE